MTSKYILALDQGTSSSRAILFNQNQEIIAISQKELPQYYPQPSWVEQKPEEIWQTQLFVAKEVIAKSKIKISQIAAIGITNQRETTIVWDKNTGKPIYNAIVWQDKRTSSYCNLLKKEKLGKYVKQTTGLIIDSYFSATKIRWILKNTVNGKQRAEKGELLFGTVDTWLLWKLTNGKYHKTDYSNASRTMLFDIHKLDWDKDLLNVLGIPQKILPEVCSSSQVYGTTNIFDEKTEIPIAGIAGDQQAALFGQTCFDEGTAKNTYGTGCFMLMNTGNKIVESEAGLLTTIAWGIDNKIEYALEGSAFITGAAIKWLRDALKIIKNAAETEKIAQEIEDNHGVYVVPAFSGLGAPYWDMYARGAIFGLTQGVTDKHIVRATLESIAYQSKDVLEAMIKDSGIELKNLFVDGGACANDFLMQFQANLLNTKVIRYKKIETTALGVAYLAGIAVGFWKKEELKQKKVIDKIFSPKMKTEQREKLYSGWKKAISRTLDWEEA